MVQQLRLHVSTAAGPTPGWGTKVPHAVQWGHQNTHTHTHTRIYKRNSAHSFYLFIESVPGYSIYRTPDISYQFS